jgi:hypothetical protein
MRASHAFGTDKKRIHTEDVVVITNKDGGGFIRDRRSQADGFSSAQYRDSRQRDAI